VGPSPAQRGSSVIRLTHIVHLAHDDLRFPPKGTPVQLANETLSWLDGRDQKSHLVSPFFVRNHLRQLTAIEQAQMEVFYNVI